MFDIELLQSKIKNGRFLGSGADRQVYAISDKVVAKIIYNRAYQSLSEIQFYEKYEEKYGHLMAKMYGYMTGIHEKGVVIFMEKVSTVWECPDTFLKKLYKPFGDQGKWELLYKMNEIKEFEEKTNLQDSSENSSNWGVTDEGKFVVLDCGINKYWNMRDEECSYSQCNSSPFLLDPFLAYPLF